MYRAALRVTTLRPHLMVTQRSLPPLQRYFSTRLSITSIQFGKSLRPLPRIQMQSRNLCTEAPPPQRTPPAPLSKKEQLKKAMKDYGSTVIVFHVGISLISLGGFYLLVSSGLDVVALVEKLGFSAETVAKVGVGQASTFVVAYAIHKVFAPVRMSITLFSTPFIVRYLRARGILKPPKF